MSIEDDTTPNQQRIEELDRIIARNDGRRRALAAYYGLGITVRTVPMDDGVRLYRTKGPNPLSHPAACINRVWGEASWCVNRWGEGYE